METLSSTVTDTAPIVKIKDAFQRLRNETRQIEVKIGVVGHTLMQAKLRQKPENAENAEAEEEKHLGGNWGWCWSCRLGWTDPRDEGYLEIQESVGAGYGDTHRWHLLNISFVSFDFLVKDVEDRIAEMLAFLLKEGTCNTWEFHSWASPQKPQIVTILFFNLEFDF
jgi:hypothetical protein